MITKEGFFEMAMINPSSVFVEPKDILDLENLTFIEKRKILISWKSECEKLIMVEREGIETQDHRILILVNEALDHIQ